MIKQSRERKDFDSFQDSYFAAGSDIIWSCDGVNMLTEKAFLQGHEDEFSDLTEKTYSSCSWHEDDFDMKFSNQINLSLRAIEDALYEQEESPLVGKEAYNECRAWADRFPYLRLKSKQLLKPADEFDGFCLTTADDFRLSSAGNLTGLQISGKRMPIHSEGRHSQRKEGTHSLGLFPEETFDRDEESEGFVNLSGKDTADLQILKTDAISTSVKSIEDKIIERIALDLWPKVINLLNSLDAQPTLQAAGSFELPPILCSVDQKQIFGLRPRTEGADVTVPDFLKLSSFLTVSPKVLQNKSRVLSSRPSSEMRLSRRKKMLSECDKLEDSMERNGSARSQLRIAKALRKENFDLEGPNSFLPVLKEDSSDHADAPKDLYFSENENKSKIDATSRTCESFLPPIKGKYSFASPTKQTTLSLYSSRTNSSRPTTAISRKLAQCSLNPVQKPMQEEPSPNLKMKDKNHSSDSDKQITLFPIVTPLVLNRERSSHSSKRGYLHNFAGLKKR